MPQFTLHQYCAALFLACLLTVPVCGQAQELFVNGDFETGTFSGWTLANQHNPADTGFNDHFYISVPGANTPPVNGVTFSTAPNPTGGNYYAVSTSDNPGAHALIQNFTVPFGAQKVSLSFDMFVSDPLGFGPVIDPAGLDYTTGGLAQPDDNQHARVDLLTSGAGDLSTATADVVTNFYLGVDAGTPPPYIHYTYDLTTLVSAGASYRLRFAEVDNDGAINMGVDNVSVFVTPEPGFNALAAGMCVMGAALLVRRRLRRA